MSFTLATDIGFSNDPAFDNTPAWNALAAAGPQWVHFAGDFSFKTKPNPVNRPVHYSGNGVNKSAFFRDYVPAAQLESFIEFTATPYFHGFAIFAREGTSGVALHINDTNHADAAVIRDLYITTAAAGKQWAVAFSAHGPNNLGLRSLTVENVELFASNVHIFWLVNVQGATLNNFNAYPAGGSVGHGTIQHGPAGRSANIQMLTRYLDHLYVYNTDNLKINRLWPISVSVSGSTNVVQF